MPGTEMRITLALTLSIGCGAGALRADADPCKAVSAGAETDAATGSLKNAGQALMGDATDGTVRLRAGIMYCSAHAGVGAPAAAIVGAFSRKRCDVPVNVAGEVQNGNVTSEPREGGISDLFISFDVAPGGPGANPVTIYQQTGCPPGSQAAYVPYSGTSTAVPFISGNDLLLRFSPALENARTYLLEMGPEVTSVAGQTLEIRGLLGDVDSSGRVNAADRSAVVSAWTSPENFTCLTDLDSSGRTNSHDRSLVVSAWTGTEHCSP